VASPLLILCLGNELISDDGFGAVVAQFLQDDADLTAKADVIFAPTAGFALLDMLSGRVSVLIVDAVQSVGGKPGMLTGFASDLLAPGYNLVTSHQISLPTAVAMGRCLGVQMPDEIDILAVEAADLLTLRQELTPAVQLALPAAVAYVKEWVLRRSN